MGKIYARYSPVLDFRVTVRVGVKDMIRVGNVFRVMAFFCVSVQGGWGGVTGRNIFIIIYVVSSNLDRYIYIYI